MYKLSTIAAGSAVVAAMAVGGISPALADGYAPKGKVVYERPTDWSGVYFGVSSGYQWSQVDSVFTNAAGVPTGAQDSADPSGGIVGAHLGIQHQFGAIVLGVEGNWISGFRTEDEYDFVTCPNPARNCGKRFNDVLTIGGRAGWAAGHWMPYFTGGYASARYAHLSEDKVGAAGLNPLIGSERFSGFYLGGGVEWKISPGWTVGLEYRHYEFGDELMQTFDATGAPSGEFRRLDPSMDSVTARVSWTFYRPDRLAPLK